MRMILNDGVCQPGVQGYRGHQGDLAPWLCRTVPGQREQVGVC